MSNELNSLRTDSSLLTAIKVASTKRSSADEIWEQRISFIYGSIGSASNITRAQIRQALVERDGGAGDRK